jgi:hypothetical protein
LASLLLLAPATAQERSSSATGPTSRSSSRPASQPADRNLLINGDFERADEGGELPADWSTKHPDNVRLVDLGGWHGHVVEMKGDKKLMASYGVDLTSEKIPVKANARYRCTGHAKSDGPNIKVFVKGYATVTRRVGGVAKTSDDIVYQMRKDIEPSDGWQPFHLEFQITPARVFSDFQHDVKYVRIRLWAYWPAGTCWFDEIRFEELGPVPSEQQRHGEAVTHVGVPPRLGEPATPPAERAPASAPASQAAGDDTPGDGRPRAARFDEQQTWQEAVNAFRGGHHKKAARLAERLIMHAPQRGVYRLLAARALAELERWEAAERHAKWLLDDATPAAEGRTSRRETESWQRDWARVVQAEVRRHTGRIDEARRILDTLLAEDCSPHARAAARKLLREIEEQEGAD